MTDGKSAPSTGETIAANYRILGTAGVGGMGVVYRALDLKLQRTVALKFLPSDLNASERDKERFLKEARTASSLDHPNIGVIYGIEETPDERTFIAMAYYEGQSLATRIRSGPLPPAEAADIATQMLKALDYAHLRGIEHRDVKPSNLMLTRHDTSAGTAPAYMVKLVDFGLAHVSQQTASKTHGISGTVAYMSPEQTLGRPVDCRSDLWAAGIVFLEMLTGRNPFARETIPATVFAILNDPPDIPDVIPPPLRQIVYRALAKDPVQRYQSGSEMVRDLEAVRASLPQAPVAASSGPVAIAQPSSRSRESNELRRSREFASTSAWMQPPAKAAWKKWAFGVGTITILILAALLVPSIRQRILPGGAAGKEVAYEGYVGALGYMQRYDKPGNLDLAIASLQGSLKIDPLFALGHAQLGEAYRMKYQTERDPKWLDLALASCQRAERLDDRLPSAYSTLGTIHNEQGKHDLALQEFHQALEINPRDPAALRGIARSNETAGKIQDAEEGFLKVIAVLPDDWRGYNDLGNFYSRQGKYPASIAQYKQALELAPDNAQIYSNLGSAYIDSGDRKLLPEAEQTLKKSLIINPGYPAFANLAALYLEEKQFGEAATSTRKALQLNDRDYNVWDNLRLAYQGLGDTAKANAAMKEEISRLESTVKLDTHNALAQATLADLYAVMGMPNKAQSRIQAALDLSPGDPQVLTEVAYACVNLHDPKRTREYIQRAVKNGADMEAIRSDPEFKALNLNVDKEFRTK